MFERYNYLIIHIQNSTFYPIKQKDKSDVDHLDKSITYLKDANLNVKRYTDQYTCHGFISVQKTEYLCIWFRTVAIDLDENLEAESSYKNLTFLFQ